MLLSEPCSDFGLDFFLVLGRERERPRMSAARHAKTAATEVIIICRLLKVFELEI